jgi:hypothetical protein
MKNVVKEDNDFVRDDNSAQGSRVAEDVRDDFANVKDDVHVMEDCHGRHTGSHGCEIAER